MGYRDSPAGATIIEPASSKHALHHLVERFIGATDPALQKCGFPDFQQRDLTGVSPFLAVDAGRVLISTATFSYVHKNNPSGEPIRLAVRSDRRLGNRDDRSCATGDHPAGPSRVGAIRAGSVVQGPEGIATVR